MKINAGQAVPAVIAMLMVAAVPLAGHCQQMSEASHSCIRDYASHHLAAALRSCRAASAEGNVEAQTRIGNIYYNGGPEMARDYAMALRWYRYAGANGSAFAQTRAGMMYRDGRGTGSDPAEALRWFKMAAAQGDTGAEFMIAGMYRYGKGVPRDDAEALKWYRKAAAAGDQPAQMALKQMTKPSGADESAAGEGTVTHRTVHTEW
ncbi:MAG: tetratricopeptide repeat protein [Candidatus Binataceae bacterium]